METISATIPGKKRTLVYKEPVRFNSERRWDDILLYLQKWAKDYNFHVSYYKRREELKLGGFFSDGEDAALKVEVFATKSYTGPTKIPQFRVLFKFINLIDNSEKIFKDLIIKSDDLRVQKFTAIRYVHKLFDTAIDEALELVSGIDDIDSEALTKIIKTSNATATI